MTWQTKNLHVITPPNTLVTKNNHFKFVRDKKKKKKKKEEDKF